MLCSCVCRRCRRMVLTSPLLWWHPSYCWVHPSQNGWVGHVLHLHVDVFIHRSPYRVTILRPASEGEVLCRAFSEVLQTKEKGLHLLFVHSCVSLPSRALPLSRYDSCIADSTLYTGFCMELVWRVEVGFKKCLAWEEWFFCCCCCFFFFLSFFFSFFFLHAQ